MVAKIKQYFLAHLIGFLFLMAGWMIPIIDTGMDRLSGKSVWTGTNLFGLVLIIIGAYLPETWISIVKRKQG